MNLEISLLVSLDRNDVNLPKADIDLTVVCPWLLLVIVLVIRLLDQAQKVKHGVVYELPIKNLPKGRVRRLRELLR